MRGLDEGFPSMFRGVVLAAAQNRVTDHQRGHIGIAIGRPRPFLKETVGQLDD